MTFFFPMWFLISLCVYWVVDFVLTVRNIGLLRQQVALQQQLLIVEKAALHHEQFKPRARR